MNCTEPNGKSAVHSHIFLIVNKQFQTDGHHDIILEQSGSSITKETARIS